MNEAQWQTLQAVIAGKAVDPLPAGFIIDSPWLPNWEGIQILDYFASEEIFFALNRRAIEEFPEAIFLPGFWSEYGMCTEPSAFGARGLFPANEFPFAEPVVRELADVDRLPEPDPEKDGLLPFVIARLRLLQPRIEAMGHKIRFSVSRGPMNVASFLMGTTEFLCALKTDPDVMHRLLRKITAFLVRWHRHQRERFPTIDGMLVLDDLVGFVGEDDFRAFGQPYLREVFDAPVAVKFFHNDADCRASVRHYPDVGINLYNPGTHLTVAEIQARTGGRLAVLGNIPPRDVLARGTPEDVRAAVRQLLADTPDRRRFMPSCGGGMPPGVSSENIRAFLQALRE